MSCHYATNTGDSLSRGVIINLPITTILAVVMSFWVSSSLWAATTGRGPDDLITIQGAGAPCPFGDFYSAAAQDVCSDSPLDTYYSYWIEVPSGTNRMVVQIFDADIAGTHDRARGPFDTAVEYQLLAPGGVLTSTASCNVGSCSGFNNNNTDNRWRRLGPAVVSPQPGLWELRIDQGSGVTSGNDINRLGIRARARNSSFSELNIFYYSSNTGADDVEGSPLDLTNYPYVTSGCTLGESNFDLDGAASMSLTSRLGTFTNISNISGNGDWSAETINAEGRDDSAEDYGIWAMDLSVNDGGASANYGNWYLNPQGQSSGAMSSRLALNDGRAFRIYLPSGYQAITGAPVKPYLAQWVRQANASNPNRFTLTVRVINPTPYAISSVQVDGESPASFVGTRSGFPSHGTFSPPTSGAAFSWTIATLPAGETAVLAFDIDVADPGVVTPVTGTVGSGGGTRARWDEYVAGNTYQTGEICELRVGPGLTEAVISGFSVSGRAGGAAVVEWETASEVGTLGFHIERKNEPGGEFVRLNDTMIPGLGLSDPQGGTYRFEDSDVAPGERPIYRLIEVGVDGSERRYGPYRVVVDDATVVQSTMSIRTTEVPFVGGGRPHPLKRGRTFVASSLGSLAGEAAVTTTSTTGQSHTAVVSGDGKAKAVKIGIRENGLYYLSGKEIGSLLGLSVNDWKRRIRRGRFSLRHRNRDVAWRAADGSEGIYFYAEGIDSLYTLDNVYWLRLDRGVRMATINGGSPEPASTAGSFTDHKHIEKDEIAVLVQSTPDYWYWNWLTNGDDKDFAFQLHGPSDGPVRMTLHLQGFSESDHAINVSVNGTPVGAAAWNGSVEREVILDFDASLLSEGDNTVTLSSEAGSGATSFVYLNGFDIRYPRHYEAMEDRLAFATGGGTRSFGSDRVVTVSGFTSGDIRLLDLGDRQRPRWIKNARIDAMDSYRISFRARAGKRRYFAVAASAIKKPAWMRRDIETRLRSRRNRADYVVITTAKLTEGARALADHQKAKGLKAKVVRLEDIYDEFNDGIEEPAAIQRFLEYAWNNWRIAPRYAALAGDGSYDHRDLLGSGDSLVPVLLTATPDGLFAADNLYGRFGNEQKIAIGRIPVHDNAELLSYVEKLERWEAGLGTPGLVQFVADDDDAAGSFTDQSNALKTLIPASRLAPADIYLKEIKAAGSSIDAARSALFGALDSGRDMVNYLGHAGVDRIAAEGLLTTADVTGLTNARTPIVNALSCVLNRFELAGFDSLGEALVLHEGGGAIAVWSPTGLSQNGAAVLLDQSLLETLFAADGVSVLGDAIVRALNDDASVNSAQWMPKVYTLLGDPALRLRHHGYGPRRRNSRRGPGLSGD